MYQRVAKIIFVHFVRGCKSKTRQKWPDISERKSTMELGQLGDF